MAPHPFLTTASDFGTTLSGFSEFHQSDLNNTLHYFTTPLGFMGFLSALNAMSTTRTATNKANSLPALIVTVIYIYLLYSDTSIPPTILLQTICILTTVLLAVGKLQLNLATSLLVMCAGYGLQDLAHLYTGEETFQQNTWGNLTANPLAAALGLFIQHVFYLQPLVCASQPAGVQSFTLTLPLLLWSYGCYAIDSTTTGTPHSFVTARALFGRFSTAREREDMKTVREWAIAQEPEHMKTTHWWVSDLGSAARSAFQRLETCDSVVKLFRTKFNEAEYGMDVIQGMNELYISGPNRKGTSDQVFFTEHIDGPFILWPFASVYRCIVGLDGNTEISTIFPNKPTSKTAQTGDILAFDFNREPHLISADGSKRNKDHRIVLKLHYVVYPRGLAIFGHALEWFNTRYNELFRALFLYTLTPKEGGFSGLVGEYAVNGGTVLYNSVEKFCGYNNLLYCAALGVASNALGDYRLFLIGTSYTHYCRYISTYYVRSDVNYGLFKRDVLFFKGVMLLQMCRLVMLPYVDGRADIVSDFNAVGFAMIVCGYAVSMAATAALGVDGTYFGIELGIVEADYGFVKSFPYNCIPHPMILSQVCALVGMHTFEWVGGGWNFAGEWWWVVPVHVALYFTHMAQEHFDYWDGEPWFKKAAKVE